MSTDYDTGEPMTEAPDSRGICGFWRRIGALFVDLIILGLVGIGLGQFFEEQFVQLGGWGRALGFVIALSYFGLMNSSLFNGQTVGKVLLRIRVVDGDDEMISPLRSMARYCVLGIPFFLNNASFGKDALLSFWMYPITVVIFGVGGSIIYLYIFNRETRQSLHDLAVGTFVVNADAGIARPGTVWRPHFAVVGAILVASAFLPFATSRLAQDEPFDQLLAAYDALSEHPAAIVVGVTAGTDYGTSLSKGQSRTTSVTARVVVADDVVTDQELAKEIALLLARNYRGIQDVDVVRVVLSYGYDIGIASFWRNHTHAWRPGELQVTT